jgi:hypothetical protein
MIIDELKKVLKLYRYCSAADSCTLLSFLSTGIRGIRQPHITTFVPSTSSVKIRTPDSGGMIDLQVDPTVVHSVIAKAIPDPIQVQDYLLLRGLTLDSSVNWVIQYV